MISLLKLNKNREPPTPCYNWAWGKIAPGKLAQSSRALRRRATAAIMPEAIAVRA
jgi:hypothetical protein